MNKREFIKKVAAKAAINVTMLTENSTCIFFMHQEKLPKKGSITFSVG